MAAIADPVAQGFVQSLPSPTASVAPWMRGIFPRTSSSRGMMPELSTEKPKSFPICRRKMLMAMPLRNPTKMGLDRKSASEPRRK